MVEPIPNADDAAAYVLGTLRSRDRRRFEAHLKKSPELQRMVRLLETGSIGMAMAAPRREPPVRLWAGIQTAVTHECEKRGSSARRMWLRSAVGIAACAIIGWFAYISRDQRASSAHPTIVANSDLQTSGKDASSAPPIPARATSQSPNLASPPSRERRALRPGENATLRERVGTLENQVAHLAETVNQQQAAPPDFNRLAFVNIMPEGLDGTANQHVAPPSPELRRALLLGVARQLGWMPPSQPPVLASTSPSTPPPAQPADPNPPAPQNDMGVEFVDLPPVEPPATETTTAPVQTPSSATSSTTASTATTTASEGSSSGNPSSIPAFVSGTNLVFAVDSSVLPVGTETVSFYSGNAGSPAVFRGTVTLASVPTVVTMPISLQFRAWDNNLGGSLTSVTAVEYSGSPAFSTAILYGTTMNTWGTSVRFIISDPSPSSP